MHLERLHQIDCVDANFWYWDGSDLGGDGFSVDDVAFDLAPLGVTWEIYNEKGVKFIADGSDTIVPGVKVQTTFSTDGGLHNHLLMEVSDLNPTPPEGVYLASLVAHAEGYGESDPFFFVHRTPGLSNEPRDVAAEWVADDVKRACPWMLMLGIPGLAGPLGCSPEPCEAVTVWVGPDPVQSAMHRGCRGKPGSPAGADPASPAAEAWRDVRGRSRL